MNGFPHSSFFTGSIPWLVYSLANDRVPRIGRWRRGPSWHIRYLERDTGATKESAVFEESEYFVIARAKDGNPANRRCLLVERRSNSAGDRRLV